MASQGGQVVAAGFAVRGQVDDGCYLVAEDGGAFLQFLEERLLLPYASLVAFVLLFDILNQLLQRL